ncbi:MAG TPA: PQQ-dependent sugar dehydrogenase [Vitreimonas sp.]|uniref:PQQ-dependent sugar dehydrogenase n=1 Tax=Vitreimonas sp. TaxID=3069702 RepID=UPI002D6F7D9A|nr:PQQ-dependent sugar dehydrogenase [Vitreimonas sp.]HYD87827.1 PQQ-dependent sugar dehydrogenase [Vitreimonas sp.]
MRRAYLLFATFAFVACSGETNGQPAQRAGAPVEQGAANTDFEPAFEGQTRAPEARSNVAIAVEEIAARLEHPWAIEVLPDGRLLVTERAGRLRVISADGRASQRVSGLPQALVRSQGGLLDVALSPNFASDRLIYWSYAEARGGGANGTSVARGRLNANATRVENVQVIFRQQPAWDSGGHFGSRLVFDGDGRLYVTLGDRQQRESREQAQDNATHIGKVVRINADGSAPADNPFAGRAGARAEIWSYGHRNVQGAALHPETGELWIVEHGPRGGDEVNIVRAARNYGWPVISYGEEYNGSPVNGGVAVRDGMEQPIYYWDPVIAPGGMLFYRGDLFPWRGNLLIAGLETQTIVRLELDGERVAAEERLLRGEVGRIRDVAEAADGALWIVTDEDNGRLLRLTPQR